MIKNKYRVTVEVELYTVAVDRDQAVSVVQARLFDRLGPNTENRIVDVVPLIYGSVGEKTIEP
jgi:hypothetical protein